MKQKDYIGLSMLEPLCVGRMLLRNFWLIVLAGAIGFFCASAIATRDTGRTYSSGATFVVTPAGTYNTDLSVAVSMAETYADLLRSDLMQSIISGAADGAVGTIHATATENSNMISVSVTADTPRDAMGIMQAVAENYNALSEYISSAATLSLLNTPSLSVRVSGGIDRGALVRIAVVGCAGAMALLLVILYFFRGTVQSAEGAARQLDAKVLGTIPHERHLSKWLLGPRRSGNHLTVNTPAVSFAFAESVYRVAGKLEQQKARGCRVFLVTSVSETEGKSTVAANVALSLASRNASVLFLDLDLRRPVQARNLGIRVSQEDELGLMLRSGQSPEEILAAVQRDTTTGMHLLLSTQPCDDAAELIGAGSLARLIRHSRELYDYVIIDLPPVGLFSESEAMMELADASLLVVRQDVVPAGIINDCIDVMRSGKAAFLGCVLNDVNSFSQVRSAYGYGYGYGKYGYGYGYHRSRRDK